MAASLGNLVGAIGGAKKTREGKKMQKKAQGYIDNFEFDDLQNAYDGVSVSRLGADLQTEELSRNMATSVDALRRGGIRGVVGGLGQLNIQNQQANRQIGADLDRQNMSIQMAKAQDDAQIRAMQENRQTQELMGYGQMLNTGMQMKYGGYADMMNAGQAQGQTNQSIMSSVMGGFTGGMGGGMMGGGGGQSAAPTVQYGTGL